MENRRIVSPYQPCAGVITWKCSAYAIGEIAAVILETDLDFSPAMCYSLKRIMLYMERGIAVREKQLRLVVAFHTTAGAMAAERLCRRLSLEGRLISVPRCVTSDCGIAWSAPPELRPTLESRFQEAGIDAAGYYELMV